MNWDIDAAVDGFWVLSCVDGLGGEPRVSEREVGLLREGLILDGGFFLLVDHGDKYSKQRFN